MPKFRYSLDSGVNWVVVDAALPYNIPSTASQDVIVEPIGAAVSNLGTVNGNFLSLTYDAANPTADVAAFTNTAGTLYWCFTNSMTPPSGAAIIAGAGFISAGNVGTVPGGLAITLPSRTGANDIFMHAIVDGADDTNIATVRVYIGTSSAFAVISGTTGSPTITDYTDGDGTWRAYEFTGAGSFTVGTGGGIEYELVAGGGGGGGGVGFVRHGGGGAGGVLRGTTTLSAGTYSVTVGSGGTGGSSGTPRGTSGGDSTAIGLTAVGGGAGATGTDGTRNALAGGSGGGGGGASPGGNNAGNGAAATSGQGFAGGDGQPNQGGGGGGAGGAGGAGSTVGGNGGVGITSTINGTSRGIAGGGAGSSNTTSGTATQGGGNAGAAGSNTNGSNATAAGAGGGAGNGTGTGGNGFRGHFVLRVKTA